MLDELRAAYQAPGSPRERLHRMMVRAAAVFESRPQEFRRLQMRISLDSPQSDNLRAAIDRIRQGLGSLMEEALYEIFRPEGETIAREIAIEGAQFARLLAQGTELEAIRNPETFEPNHILEQAELALLSLGEKRLAEKKKNQG